MIMDIPNQDVLERAFANICEQLPKGSVVIPVEKDGRLQILTISPEKYAQMTREDSGMTMSLVNETAPSEGYMVSTYPERGTWIEADATDAEVTDLIAKFVRRNSDLLKDPSNMLGTWVSDDPNTLGMISLDVSRHVKSFDDAIALGKLHNQQAVWDVANFEDIPCGGTGFYMAPVLEKDVPETTIPDVATMMPSQEKTPIQASFDDDIQAQDNITLPV